jgi:hypothetical protein
MEGAQGNAVAAEPAFPLTKTESDKFASRSTVLHDILNAGELTRILAAYQREDQRAIDAQRLFSRVATHLNMSILAIAVIGSLILALGLLQPWLKDIDARLGQAVPVVLAGLGFIGLLLGGYAAARLYELNAGNLAGDWMKSRARAEQLRSEYFERLTARACAVDTATQSAVLDLVASCLLEDQLTYFARRGKRHEVAAGRWLRWAAFASGIASVGVAAGGMAGAGSKPWLLAIAALGSIGGGVASFAAAQEAIGQERERAQRYQNNVDALEQLARKIEDVRSAVMAGSSEALITFTSAINQQLALELGRFLEGGEGIRASIAKLSDQIERSQPRKQQNDSPGRAVP